MRSSVTRRSAATSLLTEFEHAALAMGARLNMATSADLADRLASLGASSPEGDVGFSMELRRELGYPAPVNREGRPNTWVSRARLGIASTGSVLVAERQAEDRIAALLCTRHILVLPAGSIVSTLNEASGLVRSLAAAGVGYVTFVTGPSRTSDIEKVLTLGAHGPAEMDIIVLDSCEPRDD